MATILRTWSYRYPWLYQGISRTMALLVGGDRRLRHLPWQGISIQPSDHVLDLCCGRGEATIYLVQSSQHVVGLDASPKALDRARQDVPAATYVEAFAQSLPFPDHSFDFVHTSLALHELDPAARSATLGEIGRILKPGGWFVTIDFHPPTLPFLWPGLATFLLLFETETAWQWLEVDLGQHLHDLGFQQSQRILHLGGSLQVIQAQR